MEFVAWIGVAELELSGKDFYLSGDSPNVEQSSTKQAKPYQVYVGKGLAWGINLIWGISLLSEPGYGRWVEQKCTPIYSNAAFHNIALLDIGGIVVELVLFFALTGYFRWRVVQIREP